jgi:putative flippase GtrA
MTLNIFKNTHAVRFLKFACVGGLTALIYFLIMWIAQSVFLFHYLLSISLAYFVSTMFHFLMNRQYTFLATQDAHWDQLRRYGVMWVVNYLITILIVNICVERLLLSPYLGVCISVLFTSAIGYVLGHFWVFKIKG